MSDPHSLPDPIPPSGEYPGLRHGHADLGSVRLHYVEIGEGPLVVLLHGFPEFWYTWRHQLPALAAAGFRVVAPDMRGYNRSSKPAGIPSYSLTHLTGDVRDLIAERGESRARLVGHDWGGVVAYATAGMHPGVVAQLAVLNIPHPRRMNDGLRTWRQLKKSWYIGMFQLPWLPEQMAARGRYRGFRHMLQHDAPDGYGVAEIERYLEAWSQTGAMTAAMNYYRAVVRHPPPRGALRPIQAPTLVIWGERDRALGAEMAEPYARDVPGLRRVVRLPEISHWTPVHAADEVSRLLIEFFAEPAAIDAGAPDGA
jgi:pimeloyl-ACP methyl ester carboxylesterase